MNKYITAIAVIALAGAYGISSYLKKDENAVHELAETASGQTVHFNAWGGSPVINDYIEWVGDRLKEDHNITLVHVKLTDTADAVSRILAEKTAGRNKDGSVDLIWVNGENFASLKRNGLLRNDSWAFDLPSWRYTDSEK